MSLILKATLIIIFHVNHVWQSVKKESPAPSPISYSNRPLPLGFLKVRS